MCFGVFSRSLKHCSVGDEIAAVNDSSEWAMFWSEDASIWFFKAADDSEY